MERFLISQYILCAWFVICCLHLKCLICIIPYCCSIWMLTLLFLGLFCCFPLYFFILARSITQLVSYGNYVIKPYKFEAIYHQFMSNLSRCIISISIIIYNTVSVCSVLDKLANDKYLIFLIVMARHRVSVWNVPDNLYAMWVTLTILWIMALFLTTDYEIIR